MLQETRALLDYLDLKDGGVILVTRALLESKETVVHQDKVALKDCQVSREKKVRL